jgi:hypothetical protein
MSTISNVMPNMGINRSAQELRSWLRREVA